MAILLGCIADDFTGGTDLASMLVRHGMRTVQLIGVPPQGMDVGAFDAAVVALKSRTSPAEQAIADSLAALGWLQAAGARQVYFKYCSTFDSTPSGNIGPVTDALMEAIGTPFTVACPAFPANGRTVFKGHLFVGDVLLSESSMRHHPLTPMVDSNLVRVLQAQTRQRVGLADHRDVAGGTRAIRERFGALRVQGSGIAILDAVDDRDLLALGEACADLPLVTAGSGLAMGLPANFERAGLLTRGNEAGALPRVDGSRAIVSGSCSAATNAQIDRAAASLPTFRLDPMALSRGEDVAAAATAWALPRLGQAPVVIAATAAPDEVARVQSKVGRERAGELVEAALAEVALRLVDAGVGQLVVAGGETSGAVVKALGVTALQIGPEISPGVPWTMAQGLGRPLALALKSGNFGGPDFFLEAWERLA